MEEGEGGASNQLITVVEGMNVGEYKMDYRESEEVNKDNAEK